MKTNNSLSYIITSIEQFNDICLNKMREGYVCKTTMFDDGKGIIGCATFYKISGNNMPNIEAPMLNKVCLRTSHIDSGVIS